MTPDAKGDFELVCVDWYKSNKAATPIAKILYPDGHVQMMSRDIVFTIASRGDDPRTEVCREAFIK